VSLYHIPPSQIDPHAIPPPILTSEPGSFAHNTLAVRVPRIIEDTIASDTFPPDVLHALQELRAEIMRGRIRGLTEDTPDRDFWNEVSRDHLGRSWLDVPWYWAEAFFYRRTLEATHYFQPGPMYLLDPFRAVKQTELPPEVAPHAVAVTLRDLPAEASERFEVLLYSSLWGNRIDLSYKVAMEAGRAERLEDERKNLLADESAHIWRFLQAAPRRRIAMIADNAGTEVTMDLALVDFLLGNDLAGRISLHLKPQPFFVSDALTQDVEAGLEALARGESEARALAERIRAHRREGRFELSSHWFYVTSLFYFQMPDDLLGELSEADMVILKGDVNYRRLLGDAHWDPTTPFERATAYFPAPVVALRTLKAELIVGLGQGDAERLGQSDPKWMVNGRRGVVQARF
jgi:uncharacterized protein with ATP-grasp and redox domains